MCEVLVTYTMACMIMVDVLYGNSPGCTSEYSTQSGQDGLPLGKTT